jgi:hypothetical protein
MNVVAAWAGAAGATNDISVTATPTKVVHVNRRARHRPERRGGLAAVFLNKLFLPRRARR